MTARISEVIHGWLGWCPNAQAWVRQADICRVEDAVVPPGSGSFKDRAIHWLGLFRNQTILQTIGTACAGLYLFASLGGIIHPDFFITGILIGLPFSAIYGFWYLRIFDEVFHEGPVVLRHQFSIASSILVVVGALVIMYAQVYLLTGLTPWFDATITNAILGGFISVSFLGLLISIYKWESDTHRQLHYDGLILELEKEADACTSLMH